MSSEHRGAEDSVALVRRVATQLGFSSKEAEHFSVALQRYSTESLLRLSEPEAFEQFSLPPVLLRAVRSELCAARFEKPVMRCVVQPPLPEVPARDRDPEVCSDTSSRPTEVCQCPRGAREPGLAGPQGSSTPQSQLTISPRSLCEEAPQKSERRTPKADDAGQTGKPLELQRRAASLEVPPASLRGAKVGGGGVRPPSTSSTTFPSNTSSSSSSSAMTGKQTRRIIAAVTRVTPRCRAQREEAVVKKAPSTSPRSTVAVRTISTTVRPQGGSMYVPPARRSDVRLEASPARSASPRKVKPLAAETKAVQAPAPTVAAKSPRQDPGWPRQIAASAEYPVGRGPKGLGRMESPVRKAYSRRPGASREDTQAGSPQLQKAQKPKTLQEEPVVLQDSPVMPRKGSSLTLGLAGSALNLSLSNNTLLLESPRDLQNLQKPSQGYKLICRNEAPLSARVPRPVGAHSLEVPPGQSRGITRVAPAVVVRPEALTTGVVLGPCQAHVPVSRTILTSRPYPGVKSWQPGTR